MECRVLRLLKKSTAAKGRVGLAFGASEVAVAVLRRDSGTPVLERCKILPVDPAGGTGAVAAAIRAAGLPRMPVSTVLRPEDYQLALVEAPDVPPAELRAAMRWRLKESIDFRVEDAIIDVFDVPDQNRGGHGRMMYAVAARRSAVDRHAGALAGVTALDVVDVPELCLRNLGALLPAAGARSRKPSRRHSRPPCGAGHRERGARTAALLGLLRTPFRSAADYPHRGIARRHARRRARTRARARDRLRGRYPRPQFASALRDADRGGRTGQLSTRGRRRSSRGTSFALEHRRHGTTSQSVSADSGRREASVLGPRHRLESLSPRSVLWGARGVWGGGPRGPRTLR